MTKVALILAPGFEETEAIAIVDILRRLDIRCDMVGFSKEVTGSHAITVTADKVITDPLPDYDMIVLPGGLPGATNLRDSQTVMDLVRQMYQENKYVAAMCAAPLALERAGVLADRHYTAYVGLDKEIKAGTFSEDLVVVDGNVITSRGPATTFAFAYQLAELLGKDTSELRERMLYNLAFGK